MQDCDVHVHEDVWDTIKTLLDRSQQVVIEITAYPENSAENSIENSDAESVLDPYCRVLSISLCFDTGSVDPDNQLIACQADLRAVRGKTVFCKNQVLLFIALEDPIRRFLTGQFGTAPSGQQGPTRLVVMVQDRSCRMLLTAGPLETQALIFELVDSEAVWRYSRFEMQVVADPFLIEC